MKPKEKAKELVDKFYNTSSTWRYFTGDNYRVAKQCALICVDEMLLFQEKMFGQDKESTFYILEVKKEIENL